MVRHLGSLALLVALWFCFAESFEVGEIVAAVVVTAIAAVAHIALRCHDEHDRRVHVLAWCWQALCAWPRKILADTVTVLAAALRARRRPGELRTLRMPDGGERHVAWGIVGTSISPNTYVVACDEERREVLVHELVPSKKSDDDLLWWPR